jgi:hypothetical protein
MVSREVGVQGVDWVNPAQEREKHCLIDKYSSVILLLYAEIKIKNVLTSALSVWYKRSQRLDNI